MSTSFIGIDAGATSTRALVVTASGEVRGTGRAAGANSWSSGTPVADVVAGALADALEGQDPASIAGSVLAIAGGAATSAKMAEELRARWTRLGLADGPTIVPDVLASFTAGSAAADGAVLAAGTGAIAAMIVGRRIARRADGHGWLVGDAGSAVWLGIEGTRAALAALDGRGPETDLARSVPTALGISAAPEGVITAAVVEAVYSGAPAALGRLAPIVVDAAELGDDVAGSLVGTAVEELTRTLEAVVGGGEPDVIVLAGSLLGRPNPLGERVSAMVHARWPGSPVRAVESGEAGAVLLAIADGGGTVDEALLGRLRGH